MFTNAAAAIAARLHNDTVQPMQRGEKHTGAEGGVYYDPPTADGASLSCNIQPYSEELARQDYGLEVKVSKRLYALPDARLQLNALLEWQGKTYRIAALPDSRCMIVALLEVE